MKNLASLETLSNALARTLVAIIGFFSVIWGLLLAFTFLMMIPDSSSLVLLVGLGILPLLILLPLVFFAHRYLISLIGHPIAHLIAHTQLESVQVKTFLHPATGITEINVLGHSISQLTAKFLQRENFIVDNEKRLSLALSGSGEGVWDWNIEQNTSYIDENCCEILGVTSAEIEINNRVWIKNLHPDDVASAKSYFQRAANGSIVTFEQEYRSRKNSTDDWLWIQIRGSIVERDHIGRPLRMAGTVSDVTRRKNVEQQLKLYSTAFMCTKNAVMMLDNEFGALAVNRAFCDITQQQNSMVVGKPYVFHHPTIASDTFHELIKTQVHNRTQWVGEAVGKRIDGSQYPLELAVYGVFDDRLNLTHYVVIFADITERKRTEDNLRLLANYDPLTGLPNRYMFNNSFTRSIQSAKRKSEKLALLFIDLDHFKEVNDSCGHAAGDRLLVEVARRIQNSIRETDTAARLAGDEFVVVLENIQVREDVELIADKILKAMIGVSDSIKVGLEVSASIGISLFPDHGTDLEALLRKADRAMYEAKTLGRNQLYFHNPDPAYGEIVSANDSADS